MKEKPYYVECGGCKGKIYEGDRVLRHKGEFYCCKDCLIYALTADAYSTNLSKVMAHESDCP